MTSLHLSVFAVDPMIPLLGRRSASPASPWGTTASICPSPCLSPPAPTRHLTFPWEQREGCACRNHGSGCRLIGHDSPEPQGRYSSRNLEQGCWEPQGKEPPYVWGDPAGRRQGRLAGWLPGCRRWEQVDLKPVTSGRTRREASFNK